MSRIRDKQAILTAAASAATEVKRLLQGETNEGWGHDHVAVLAESARLIERIMTNPCTAGVRRDLGRLVTENNGVDFPEPLQRLLLRISTANVREGGA